MVSSDLTAQEKHRAERDKGEQPRLRLTLLLILISLFSEVVSFNILLKQTVGTTIVFREPSCQYMRADFMTKPLQGEKFRKFRDDILGIS